MSKNEKDYRIDDLEQRLHILSDRCALAERNDLISRGGWQKANEELNALQIKLDEQQDELSRLRRIEQTAKDNHIEEELSMRLLLAEGELRHMKKDLEDAAGELMVEIPEPGSQMAKMLSANVLIRRERDRYWETICDLRSERDDLFDRLDRIVDG